MNDIREIKESIDQIIGLTKDTKIPLGLKEPLNEAFQCIMCIAMPKPPYYNRQVLQAYPGLSGM